MQSNTIWLQALYLEKDATLYPHMLPKGMKATYTRDLITGYGRINVRTCAEAINYMGEIYGFIRDKGIECKMTTDFHRVSFVIRDFDNRADIVPLVMDFIRDIENGTIKGN